MCVIIILHVRTKASQICDCKNCHDQELTGSSFHLILLTFQLAVTCAVHFSFPFSPSLYNLFFLFLTYSRHFSIFFFRSNDLSIYVSVCVCMYQSIDLPFSHHYLYRSHSLRPLEYYFFFFFLFLFLTTQVLLHVRYKRWPSFMVP